MLAYAKECLFHIRQALKAVKCHFCCLILSPKDPIVWRKHPSAPIHLWGWIAGITAFLCSTSVNQSPHMRLPNHTCRRMAETWLHGHLWIMPAPCKPVFPDGWYCVFGQHCAPKKFVISPYRSLYTTLRQAGVSKASAQAFAYAIPAKYIRSGRSFIIHKHQDTLYKLQLRVDFHTQCIATLKETGSTSKKNPSPPNATNNLNISSLSHRNVTLADPQLSPPTQTLQSNDAYTCARTSDPINRAPNNSACTSATASATGQGSSNSQDGYNNALDTSAPDKVHQKHTVADARSFLVPAFPKLKVTVCLVKDPVQFDFVRVEGKIKKDLRQAIAKQGVPTRMANDIVQALGRAQVNWRHFVTKNSRFRVLFQQKTNTFSGEKMFGQLYFVHFDTPEKTPAETTFYCYRLPGARSTRMYTSGGALWGDQKPLFCKPVTKGRLTSGFGWRVHPIDGVGKMHQGVDYAAPRGTPVMAAASGHVSRATIRSGYGKCVELCHSGGHQTLYAHLERFTPCLKPGQTVCQGQVIGYVGSTGKATGPHLHFEVHYAKRPINPMAKLGKNQPIKLSAQQQVCFRHYVKGLQTRYQHAQSPSALN